MILDLSTEQRDIEIKGRAHTLYQSSEVKTAKQTNKKRFSKKPKKKIKLSNPISIQDVKSNYNKSS